MPNAKELISTATRLAGQRKWLEAGEVVRQTLAVEPLNIEAKLLLGIVHSKTGDANEALSCFDSVLHLEPDNFVALNLASVQCRKSGDPNLGIEYCRRALEIQPDHPEPALNLAYCYAKLGQRDEANAWVDRAMAVRPNQTGLLVAMASLLQELRRNNEEASVLETAVTLSPNEPAFIRLMELHLAEGRLPEVLRVGDRAIQMQCGGAQVHLLMARASLTIGDAAEAAYHFNVALHKGPHNADVLVEAGFWQQSLGSFDTAEDYFEGAVRSNASHGIAYFGLVHCRKMADSDRPLIDQMRTLATAPHLSDNHRAHLLYALGKSFDDLGEPSVAIGYFDQANDLYGALTLTKNSFDPDQCRAEVNRRIKVDTPKFFHQVHPFVNKSELPVLVLGMMRSGTTLVEQILSRHPDIGGAGEVQFWTQRETSETPDPQTLERIGTEYVELLQRKAKQKAKVVDKNPANVMVAGLIHAALPNAKIIHTLRDPADTALSMWITHLTQPPEFCCSRAKIVTMYREYWRLADHWRKTLPSDRYLEVAYEDLVDDPESTIRKMIEFMELEWCDQCLHPEGNQKPVTTPSGWQVRQPLYKSSVARWKQYEPWIPEFVQLRADLLGEND